MLTLKLRMSMSGMLVYVQKSTMWAHFKRITSTDNCDVIFNE